MTMLFPLEGSSARRGDEPARDGGDDAHDDAVVGPAHQAHAHQLQDRLQRAQGVRRRAGDHAERTGNDDTAS